MKNKKTEHLLQSTVTFSSLVVGAGASTPIHVHVKALLLPTPCSKVAFQLASRKGKRVLSLS